MLFRRPLMLLLPILWVQTVAAQTEDLWYAGLGFGSSTLKPGTGTTRYTIDGDGGTGLNLIFGRRLNEQMSVEGVWTDLGSADIGHPDPLKAGSIDYSFLGVNLKYDFIPKPEKLPKLKAFVKAGLGSVSRDTQLGLDEDGSLSGYFGLGVEWQLPNNFSVRGGFNQYAEDAQSIDVAVTKYFGISKGGFSLAKLKMPSFSKPKEKRIITENGVEIINAQPIPGAVKRMAKKLKPTSMLVFLRFSPNSAELTKASRKLLDKTIDRMNSGDSVGVMLVGASSGAYSRDMAKTRGKAAGGYLAKNGFPKKSLRSVRYSELRSKPVK
ncbi:MAG: outer membrane beta-barrel protein [Methylococcales bacterium]|nr:outer membrane beta-barrel protein [Methylococcales bacterium]